jgi:hypothetical protein
VYYKDKHGHFVKPPGGNVDFKIPHWYKFKAKYISKEEYSHGHEEVTVETYEHIESKLEHLEDCPKKYEGDACYGDDDYDLRTSYN